MFLSYCYAIAITDHTYPKTHPHKHYDRFDMLLSHVDNNVSGSAASFDWCDLNKCIPVWYLR